MMWGSLAGGMAQGLHGGVDIAAQIAALQDHQRMRNAHAAVGRAMAGDGFGGGPPMPQPPMPGAASMPTGGPGPGAGPAPFDSSMAGAPDPGFGGGMALPGGGAPPVPQPPQPMALPPPNPGAAAADAGPAAGAPPAQSDAVKDAQSTITNIARSIKAANPNISPEELFDATGAHIEQMKGVRNDVRDYMQQQVELAKIQARLQVSETRLSGVEYSADANKEGRLGAANIRGQAQRDVADTQGRARIGAAGISGDSRVKAAGIGADARVTSAGIGADSRRDVAGTRADSSDYSADQNYRGRVDSATALSGGTGRTAAPARPMRSRSAPGATAYKSADDVKAAFHANKITQAQAVSILKSQFGMK